MTQTIATAYTINEAADLLSTYKLNWLIWKFEDCPLPEVQHYVPNGKEEFVIVCHKDETRSAERLILTNGDELDAVDYIVTLKFHPNYDIVIVLDPTLESNRDS